MTSYVRGIELLLLAWGWRLHEASPVPAEARSEGQEYQRYNIRLYKVRCDFTLIPHLDIFLL